MIEPVSKTRILRMWIPFTELASLSWSHCSTPFPNLKKKYTKVLQEAYYLKSGHLFGVQGHRVLTPPALSLCNPTTHAARSLFVHDDHWSIESNDHRAPNNLLDFLRHANDSKVTTRTYFALETQNPSSCSISEHSPTRDFSTLSEFIPHQLSLSSNPSPGSLTLRSNQEILKTLFCVIYKVLASSVSIK